MEEKRDRVVAKRFGTHIGPVFLRDNSGSRFWTRKAEDAGFFTFEEAEQVLRKMHNDGTDEKPFIMTADEFVVFQVMEL